MPLLELAPAEEVRCGDDAFNEVLGESCDFMAAAAAVAIMDRVDAGKRRRATFVSMLCVLLR